MPAKVFLILARSYVVARCCYASAKVFLQGCCYVPVKLFLTILARLYVVARVLLYACQGVLARVLLSACQGVLNNFSMLLCACQGVNHFKHRDAIGKVLLCVPKCSKHDTSNCA